MTFLFRYAVLVALLVPVAATAKAQRRLLVVNAETKVPVRDVQVYTDNNHHTRTLWDGTCAVPDSFGRVSFRHPNYVQRYILRSELRNDTVWLLPKQHVLNEVVVWGHRRFDERMASILRPSPQQVERDKLPQVIPAGPNVLALMAWVFEKTIGKKMAQRAKRKKSLKAHRQKEEELQQLWEALKDTTAAKPRL